VTYFNGFVHVDKDVSFTETIVFSVRGQAIELSLDVVPDNMELVETTPESLGSWQVSNITESENIRVFFMLKSVGVDIKLPSWISKSSFSQIIFGFGLDSVIEMIIRLLDGRSSFYILENGSLSILFDFN